MEMKNADCCPSIGKRAPQRALKGSVHTKVTIQTMSVLLAGLFVLLLNLLYIRLGSKFSSELAGTAFCFLSRLLVLLLNLLYVSFRSKFSSELAGTTLTRLLVLLFNVLRISTRLCLFVHCYHLRHITFS